MGLNTQVVSRREDDMTTSQLMVFGTRHENAGNYTCQGYEDTRIIHFTSVMVTDFTGKLEDRVVILKV